MLRFVASLLIFVGVAAAQEPAAPPASSAPPVSAPSANPEIPAGVLKYVELSEVKREKDLDDAQKRLAALKSGNLPPKAKADRRKEIEAEIKKLRSPEADGGAILSPFDIGVGRVGRLLIPATRVDEVLSENEVIVRAPYFLPGDRVEHMDLLIRGLPTAGLVEHEEYTLPHAFEIVERLPKDKGSHLVLVPLDDQVIARAIKERRSKQRPGSKPRP